MNSAGCAGSRLGVGDPYLSERQGSEDHADASCSDQQLGGTHMPKGRCGEDKLRCREYHVAHGKVELCGPRRDVALVCDMVPAYYQLADSQLYPSDQPQRPHVSEGPATQLPEERLGCTLRPFDYALASVPEHNCAHTSAEKHGSRDDQRNESISDSMRGLLRRLTVVFRQVLEWLAVVCRGVCKLCGPSPSLRPAARCYRTGLPRSYHDDACCNVNEVDQAIGNTDPPVAEMQTFGI
eukprot:6224315-Prymnesium_polylepis.2